MAEIRPLVLTASLDDPDAVRDWCETVVARARKIQTDVDALVEELRNAPHIAITLHQDSHE